MQIEKGGLGGKAFFFSLIFSNVKQFSKVYGGVDLLWQPVIINQWSVIPLAPRFEFKIV